VSLCSNYTVNAYELCCRVSWGGAARHACRGRFSSEGGQPRQHGGGAGAAVASGEGPGAVEGVWHHPADGGEELLHRGDRLEHTRPGIACCTLLSCFLKRSLREKREGCGGLGLGLYLIYGGKGKGGGVTVPAHRDSGTMSLITKNLSLSQTATPGQSCVLGAKQSNKDPGWLAGMVMLSQRHEETRSCEE